MLLDAKEEPAPAPAAALPAPAGVPYDPRVRPIGRFEQVKPESERIIVPATDEELRDRLGVRAPAPSDALVSMMSRKTEDAA